MLFFGEVRGFVVQMKRSFEKLSFVKGAYGLSGSICSLVCLCCIRCFRELLRLSATSLGRLDCKARLIE